MGIPRLRRVLACLSVAVACLGVLTVDGFTPHAVARGKKGDDPAVEAFKAGYESDDAKTRADAVSGLTKAPDEVKVALISKYVLGKEKRADVIARAVNVLESVEEPDQVARMIKNAESGKLPSRLVFIEALARVEGTPAHVALIELLEDKEPQVRGMAAYSLGEHRAMDALDGLITLLEDPFWQVQAASLSAMRRLADKEVLRARAVPAIVDYLDELSGRMAHDAAETLAKITGKRHGRDVDKWRKYMAGEEIPPDEKGAGTGRDGYGAQRPHFYGMEVVSNRVVLLMDVSLSMVDAIEIDKDRLRRETSRRRDVTGVGSGGGEKPEDEDHAYDIPWWRIKTRLDLAREQTILLISQLGEDQFFEIIFFSTDINPWMGKLVPATSNNKQKAITALRNIVPEDKTNTWGAIAEAFDMMGNEKKSYELGPDEMYLVTDGAPSVGDIVDHDQILDAVIQLYKTKQIRINCIGVGVNLRFMRKMCRATGGEAKFFE